MTFSILQFILTLATLLLVLWLLWRSTRNESADLILKQLEGQLEHKHRAMLLDLILPHRAVLRR
jgi:hypothetical protein